MERKTQTRRLIPQLIGSARSVNDRAAFLGISPKKLRREIAEGKVGHHRIGTRIVISDEQWAEYLTKTEVPAIDAAGIAQKILGC